MDTSHRRTAFLIFAAFLLAANLALAATTTPADLPSLIAQLQQQIQSLRSQVAELRSQLEVTQAELKFTRALQRGASGDEVRQLQEFLKQYPDIYPEGLVTGYFGSLTEAAVKRLQEKQGLESVGIVGPKTRAKLNELATEGAAAPALGAPTPPSAPAGKVVICHIPPGNLANTQTLEIDASALGAHLAHGDATGACAGPVAPPPPGATTTPPVAVPPPPPPPVATSTPPAPPTSATPDIRTGTGSVVSGGAFSFPTGTMSYSMGDYGAAVKDSYGILLSTFLTSPAVSFANVIPVNQYTADYQGISNICQFTSAANYTFRQPHGVQLYDKAAPSYHGILLFKQGSYYGGIDPEDVTASGTLSYRYWYDASGGSNFSSLCTAAAPPPPAPAPAPVPVPAPTPVAPPPASATTTAPAPAPAPAPPPSSADTVSPVISNIAVAFSTLASGQPVATISWTTNESADTQLRYGLNSLTGPGGIAHLYTLSTAHSMQTDALQSGGAYVYEVASTDAAGNTASSTPQSFTVSGGLPDLLFGTASNSSIPTPYPAGQAITFTYSIRNSGVGSASAPGISIGTTYGRDDIRTGATGSDPAIRNFSNTCTGSLASGASCTVSFDLSYTTSGFKNIYFKIDPLYQLVESNQNNNDSIIGFNLSMAAIPKPAVVTFTGADGTWCYKSDYYPEAPWSYRLTRKGYCQDHTGVYSTDYCSGSTIKEYSCGLYQLATGGNTTRCELGGFGCSGGFGNACSDGACITATTTAAAAPGSFASLLEAIARVLAALGEEIKRLR